MITELVDTLTLKPGLMRLYEAALQAGRKPEELGLPALGLAGETGVCRAVLTDAHGRVVATATAAKRIQAYKDLEILETAARKRLLAALGYGGDVLDEDERQDQRDQGLVPASAADAEPEAAPLADDQGAEPAQIASAPPPRAAVAAGNDPALAMLNRQIQHQAGLRGVTVAPAASVDEARAALKSLLEAAA